MSTNNKDRIDWAAIVKHAQENPGEEIIAGDGIPGSTRTYVKRRYGIEARMQGQDPATNRGTLIVWWPK